VLYSESDIEYLFNFENRMFFLHKSNVMKKRGIAVLAIFGLVMGSLGLSAQEMQSMMPLDKDTQLISYQEVVSEPGTADVLYVRCIEWINTQYKNPADVCKVRNRESAVIEIQHRFEIFNSSSGSKLLAGIVNYDLKIEFKPGRYRYTISDLTLRQSSRFPIERWFDKSDPMYSPIWEDYLQQVDTQIKELIANLKQGMAPPVVKHEEKW